jgi:putative FmdB family regulatory protein
MRFLQPVAELHRDGMPEYAPGVSAQPLASGNGDRIPLGMPLYEYVCEQDGFVIELLRPMADADKPVPDPEGKGRTFARKQSSFAAKAGGTVAGSSLPTGGCCPCGKAAGSCGGR